MDKVSKATIISCLNSMTGTPPDHCMFELNQIAKRTADISEALIIKNMYIPAESIKTGRERRRERRAKGRKH